MIEREPYIHKWQKNATHFIQQIAWKYWEWAVHESSE